MRKISRPIRRFFSLPGRRQRLFVEALLWLAASRCAILLFPFRYIAPLLGVQRRLPDDAPHNRGTPLINDVGWAVTAAARHTLWKSTCLTQAMAAKMMLKIRGQPSSLYLGVAKGDEKEIKAHAWLVAEGIILTGADIKDEYTVVSVFTESAQ